MNLRRFASWPIRLVFLLMKLVFVYVFAWAGLITLLHGYARVLGQVWEGGEVRQATAVERFGGVVTIAAALLTWLATWAVVSSWFRLPRLRRQKTRQRARTLGRPARSLPSARPTPVEREH
jgi:hypothetical protein